MTAIVAGSGIGKSGVCEGTVSTAINPQADGLGLSLVYECRVVYMDTERSTEDHWTSWARMMRRAGLEQGCNTPKNVRFELLATIPSFSARQEYVMQVINEEKPDVLILDGIGDLTASVNDEVGCGELVGRLLAQCKQSDTALIVTLHTNPYSEKSRGHLGSEVMRKAESVILLKRDAETGQRTLTTGFEFGKVRNAPDVLESYFTWDHDAGMFLTCDNQVEKHQTRSTSKYDGIADKLSDLRDTWTFADLLGDIRVVCNTQDETKAKNIYKELKRRKNIVKNNLQQWIVNDDFGGEI